MSNATIVNAVGIISTNSIDYVEKLFSLYKTQQTAILLKEKTKQRLIKGLTIDHIIEPDVKTGWFSPSVLMEPSDDIAQVSFTSGTEGEPKAIAISHRALDNTARRLVDIQQLDKTIKEYIGAPVNFSFGLGRCRAIAFVNGRGYIPENGFDPLEISRMLNNHEINAISAVPTLWRILLSQKKYFDGIGDRLKWIEIGSQYMSSDEKQALRKLFPKAKIVQHYGLTEASRTTFLDISHDSDHLESVGQPTNDIQVKLNADNKICIKGPHLCSGLVSEGEVKSLSDRDGWFETSDYGEIKDGYLYYKGRADDVINCGGIKISPETLEREIRRSQTKTNSINGFCISKIPDVERGEIPLLAILSHFSDKQKYFEELALQELRKLGLNLSSIPTIFMDEFPVTGTGKIQRKKISSQFQPSEKKQDSFSKDKATSVGEIFENLFKKKNINKDLSFNSLGGDSLNYVKATIELEEYFGYLPKSWSQLSISSLEKLSRSDTKSKSIEIDVMLRTVAILAVVMGHSGFSFIGGGTQLLFVLVGYNLARFQSKHIISGDVWSSIYKYAIKLIIPYMILVISYFIWKETFSWDRILFYTNYMSFDARSPVIFPAWFIQVLLQSLLILGAIFSFKTVRTQFSENLWFSSYLFMLIFLAIRIIFPHIYDTNHLFARVPPIYLASLWLGWLILFSESKQEKAITFVTALILSVEHLGVELKSLWISCGSFFLLYKDSIELPRALKSTLTTIALATFYIYLFHMIFIHIPANILELHSPIINSAFGVCGGVIVWYFFDRLRVLKIYSFAQNIIKHKIKVGRNKTNG